MARLAVLSQSEEADKSRVTPNPKTRSERVSNVGSLSPSPTTSLSSDKENRALAGQAPQEINGKSKSMAPPKLPTPVSAEQASARASKRRRLGERDAPNASQVTHERELQDLGNAQFYDPDQSMDERRAVRKGIRELAKELNDSRAECLAPGSDNLFKTLRKANEIFTAVKQTSDATLDSRLLVSAADLSTKRISQLNVGDASQGIDVDEFVGKCITFMRRGPGVTDSSTSQRRRQRHRGDYEEDNDSPAEASADEEDAMNWEWLGRQACFPHNLRPPVPGFLLGPLSVQKRARKQTQRRERLQKRDPRDAVRPEELKAQDLQKVENSNLTTLCRNIRELLVRKMKQGREDFEREDTAGKSTEEVRALMARHGIADDTGVPLFHFVINPRSFGQTVENLFYVSFLIKDGTAGISHDSDGFPTLHGTIASSSKDQAQIQDLVGAKKRQAVFHLDFNTWEDLIDALDITASIIPHRHDDADPAQVSASGWYG